MRLDGRLRPAPALSTEWTISDDLRTYTFTLRPRVQFHDGSRLDAAAVKASLERVRTLASPDTAAFLLFDTANDPPQGGIVSLDARAPDRLVVTLAQPDAAFLTKMAFAAASAVPPRAYPADREAPGGVLVGTGPFRFSTRRSELIRLVRNEGYWGQAPRAELVELRLFRRPADLRTALESGEVDVALHGFAPRDVGAFRKSSVLKVVEAPGAAVRMLSFNLKREPVDDVHVRRAIAAAIDRRGIADKVLGGAVTPLYGMLPSAFAERRDDFKGITGHSVVAAELKQAGITDDQRIALEIWYTPTHYGDTEKQLAQSIEAALEATRRFDVTLRSSEWAGYKASFARGDLPAFLLGWFPDYLDAEDYVEPFMGTAGARALGSNYSDPTVDKLLSEQRTTSDPARRTAMFAEIQQKAATDVPLVPLWEAKQFAVTHRDVSGVELDPAHLVRLSSVARL